MPKPVKPFHTNLHLLQPNSGGLKQGESALHGCPILPAQGSNRLSIASMFSWQKFWENPPTGAIYVALENETTVEGMQKSITEYIENLRM